ncbi:MAG: cupin domain-containing protein [Euryarchaeota archaeon]|nr:cupin domain-containing protein [Euryarchaeota archaeon]
MAENRITVVKAKERRPPASQTPGMIREEAFAGDDVWAGYVRTEPNKPSGWHTHGDHDSYIYVVDGRLRFQYGADAKDAVEAGPGDFVRVPPHTVHREDNPSSVEGKLVVIRFGKGPPSVNVEGPAAKRK